MKSKPRKIRTLALEIRLRRVGFAVFEGSDRLLDWGIRRWDADACPAVSVTNRVAPLLVLYSPAVVILKDLGHTNRSKRRTVIMAVKRKIGKLSIDVHMVRRDDVRQAFRQSGSENKYQIASTIAAMFPGLKRKLPQKRKPWQPERYNAVLFDAIALALAHQSECKACFESTKTESS